MFNLLKYKYVVYCFELGWFLSFSFNLNDGVIFLFLFMVIFNDSYFKICLLEYNPKNEYLIWELVMIKNHIFKDYRASQAKILKSLRRKFWKLYEENFEKNSAKSNISQIGGGV